MASTRSSYVSLSSRSRFSSVLISPYEKNLKLEYLYIEKKCNFFKINKNIPVEDPISNLEIGVLNLY